MPQTEETVNEAPAAAPVNALSEDMIKKLNYVLNFAFSKGIEITEVKIDGRVLQIKEAVPANETEKSKTN